ncbi:MAG: LysR family transcriptional regulator, partial [Clostridium sp.]
MEFRQIEAFVNAVKYKSFSKAADATFLTQPTISAHISNLENELEITLLKRVGREVTLTPQGQQFYPNPLD